MLKVSLPALLAALACLPACQSSPAASPNDVANGASERGSSVVEAAMRAPAALEECPHRPSVDGFSEWIASGEGSTVPAQGSILAQEGGRDVAKVQMLGAGWHVIPVYIKNKFGEAQDLSGSSGITLTYSATAELHVQLRSKSHWDGGEQYATTLPATGGKQETRVFSFAESGWKSLFGPPALSFADTLKESMGLVFVANGENQVVFYGMHIDGYTPSCP
jgi:hypothetical protein